MNIRVFFVTLWVVASLIGGIFVFLSFEIFLDSLLAYALPWFIYHPVVLAIAEYIFSVMITMAIIWVFSRDLLPARAECVKNAPH